jgi:hypothetical protein
MVDIMRNREVKLLLTMVDDKDGFFYHGIQEVSGSIPLISTKKTESADAGSVFLTK